MLETIKQIVSHIRSQVSFNPEVGIILGSGMASLVNRMEIIHSIEYISIPKFLVSTVEGHSGKLIFGKFGGKNVVVMQGRFHFYEGYSLQQLALPIRVLKYLGINTLFLSCASGGLNSDYNVGDLMIFEDHINLMPGNPLIGPNEPEFGVRFPDMSMPYNKELIQKGLKVSNDLGLKTHLGVFVAVPGPSLESRAEYRYLRTIGADAVAMSTVPEVIAARHLGLPCFAVAIITNSGVPDEVKETTHEDVLRIATEAETKLTALFENLLLNI